MALQGWMSVKAGRGFGQGWVGGASKLGGRHDWNDLGISGCPMRARSGSLSHVDRPPERFFMSRLSASGPKLPFIAVSTEDCSARTSQQLSSVGDYSTG